MRRFILPVFLMTLFLSSCQRQERSEPKKPQERKVVVSLYKLKVEDVPVEYNTKGYFEGERDVTLKPLVSGRVVSLMVEEGNFVKSGQALLRVDPADYENSVRQVEAQLAQARANYENLKAVVERRRFLFERELIAREEYESLQTQLRSQEELLKSLQAQLNNAKLNLSRTTLTAPFSGYIAQRLVNLGDYVTPQTQTLRLVTLNPIRLVFQIPQEYLPYAKESSKVRVRVEPFGDFEGKVFFLSPVADQNRLLTVKARLDNSKGLLKPGMYGEVSLIKGVERAFVVPEQAVVLQGNRRVVWKVQDGVAQPVQVEVIKQGQGLVYLKGDLKEGEGIALENAYILQQGIRVEVR
ncbi:MAG: efflux RND transporter periplasmic adaptor subunit [Aquificaceae bacterium]|nr:efflux RND transporter periplasmic adaptor subunit [Aquificaceae bacterium]